MRRSLRSLLLLAAPPAAHAGGPLLAQSDGCVLCWRWRLDEPLSAANLHRRDADEAPAVPPLTGIAIGADADNTQGRSVGHLATISLH